MSLHNNPERMWFGTEQRMGWIETPQTGADVSSIGMSAESTLLGGGAYARNSWDSHKTYQFSWGESAPPSMVSLLQAYRNGSYGRGLLYFHDPMYYRTNLLPKRWADPSMAVNYEAEPLIPNVWPTATPVVSGANNYPVNAATYAVPSGFSSQISNAEHYIPIPPGMVLVLGAVYSAVNGPTIYVRTPAGTSTLLSMTPDDNTVVNTIIRNQPWARIGIRNTLGAGSITITGATARLADSVPATDALPFSYTNLAPNPSLEGTTGAAVEVRRNLIRYSDTSSATGWTGTNGASATEGGRLKYTAVTAGSVRLGGTTPMVAPKPAGDYVASYRVEALDPTVTGARVYLYDANTATIRASLSLPLTNGGIDAKYVFPLTATGVFNLVYMETYGGAGPVAVGSVAYISEPLLEETTLVRPFFNGNQVPKVRRNLALNPRALATGPNGWLSNNVSTNPIIRGVTPPIAHPLGIETAVMQRSTGTNGTLGTIYSMDSLANTNTPPRTSGAWVLVNEPGYSAYGVSITENEWTFIRVPTPISAGGYASFFITKDSGTASTTARAYITGAIIEEDPNPVGEYFDGGTGAPSGFLSAWDAGVSSSASYLYDADLSVAWTAIAGSSEAILTGERVSGVANASVGLTLDGYRTRQSPSDGNYSARWTAITSSALAIPVSNVPPTAGQTYTLLFRARSNTRTLQVVPRIGASVGEPVTLPQGEFVDIALTLASATANSLATGLYVAPNQGHLPGDTFDIDAVTLVLGEYTGGYFDGNSPGAVWNGTVNASTSTVSGVSPISGGLGLGPWYSGEGHSGVGFVGNPTVINYNGVGGGQIGLSCILREVGAWA